MANRSRKRSLAAETVHTLTGAQIESVVGGKAVTDALIRNPPRFSETPSCGLACLPPKTDDL
jgi:hypothetical protein